MRGLRGYAGKRGWTIALQVKEVGSGASQRQLRERLLELARRREIDVMPVWRLDRWGRSVADLLATLQEFEARLNRGPGRGTGLFEFRRRSSSCWRGDCNRRLRLP